MRDNFIARSRSDSVLGAASAGGATTSLLLTALDVGIADAALVIGRDDERPWTPKARLVDDPADVIGCAQASYCLTPNLQLLRDSRFERIAVVTLACQAEAIGRMRNLPQPPPEVQRVSLVIEIACASNTRLAGTEYLIEEELRIPLAEVARVRYRDGEYPGEFTVWTKDGGRRSIPFHRLVTVFKRFKTQRCLTCPDWWSGVADVSVADGDPNIFKTSRDGAKVEKTSLLVVRTDLGEELAMAAVRSDALELIPTEFVPEESLGLQRKRHRYYSYREAGEAPLPSEPVVEEEAPHEILGDDEVIERLSGRNKGTS